MSVRSGRDTFVAFGGSSASCRVSDGGGVTVPEAGAGVAVSRREVWIQQQTHTAAHETKQTQLKVEKISPGAARLTIARPHPTVRRAKPSIVAWSANGLCVLTGGDSKHVALYDCHEGTLYAVSLRCLASLMHSSKLTGRIFHTE